MMRMNLKDSISKGKQVVNELMYYAKWLSCLEARFLDEGAVQDCFNTDNAAVNYQMTDSKICEIMSKDAWW